MFWLLIKKPEPPVYYKVDGGDRDGWYVCCSLATKAFPHSGYLRCDGTWGISMRMENKRLGYFETKQQAEEALQKWLT